MDKSFEDMTRKEKRLARVIALQALYAHEVAETEPGNAIATIVEELEESPSADVITYGGKLTRLAIDHRESSDGLIEARLKNWEMKRVSLMDKLILRLEISEMLHEDSVPPKVSIVEGVEIAKIFSTDDSSRFVNGILDSVYNDSLKGLFKFEI
ncbi:MAG: transcription antitermination factor NusB [Candidatus Marinimicrobia bacterium]|nr:transcription antitermination factor NusB [Candidatus Neomarinimicrobiota bacterium]